MLEDFSYADSQVTEGSLLSQLWDICEASQSTVKLVLPDALDRPFYLPKLIGRKALTPAQVDRENKRNEFLSQRDVASIVSPRGKRSEIISFKFHTKRDIEIEARLLDEFRNDKEKLANLRTKVSLKKKLKFNGKSKKKIVLKDKLSSIHEHRLDEIDRHQRVTMRKSVMLMAEEESRDAATQSWRNRVSQMMAGTSQAIMQTKNSGRAKSWIAIVAVLNKLAVITSIVVKARKVKAKNKNK